MVVPARLGGPELHQPPVGVGGGRQPGVAGVGVGEDAAVVDLPARPLEAGLQLSLEQVGEPEVGGREVARVVVEGLGTARAGVVEGVEMDGHHRVGGGRVAACDPGDGVDVHAAVGDRAVDDLAVGEPGDRGVGDPREDDVEAVGPEHVLQLQRHRQGQVLLLQAVADRARVGPAVAGVDVDRAMAIGAGGVELDAGASDQAGGQVGARHREDARARPRPGCGLARRTGAGGLRLRTRGRGLGSAGARVQQRLDGDGRGEDGDYAQGEAEKAAGAGAPAPAAAIGYEREPLLGRGGWTGLRASILPAPAALRQREWDVKERPRTARPGRSPSAVPAIP